MKKLWLVCFCFLLPLTLWGQSTDLAVALPDWKFLPKSSHNNWKFRSNFAEFQGLLDKRGGSTIPSIFVLKYSMPEKSEMDQLEVWLNKKYFRNKATLNLKRKLENSSNLPAHVYIFTVKDPKMTYINFFYTYKVGKNLVVLSQSSTVHNYKNDLRVSSQALKHIKFIQ